VEGSEPRRQKTERNLTTYENDSSMVIPDSVIEQLKGLVDECRSKAEHAQAVQSKLALEWCASRIDTLLSTLLAAPRDQGDAQEMTAARLRALVEQGMDERCAEASHREMVLSEIDAALRRAASRSPEGTEK
jgi:hypothetical protein